MGYSFDCLTVLPATAIALRFVVGWLDGFGLMVLD